MANILRGPVYVRPSPRSVVATAIVPNLLVGTLAVAPAPFVNDTAVRIDRKQLSIATTYRNGNLLDPANVAPFAQGTWLPMPSRQNQTPWQATGRLPLDLVTVPFIPNSWSYNQRKALVPTFQTQIPAALLPAAPLPAGAAQVPLQQAFRRLPGVLEGQNFVLPYAVAQRPFFNAPLYVVARKPATPAPDIWNIVRILDFVASKPFSQNDWPGPAAHVQKYEQQFSSYAPVWQISAIVTVTIKAGSWIRYRKI